MSFFLQAKRNTDFLTPQTPSPFDYDANPQRKKLNRYAPFNSTTKLNRSEAKVEKNGKINEAEQERGFTIDDNNIQMMAQQRMNSMFKSRSQRIMHSVNNVPGPGSYQLRSKYKNPKVKHPNANKSSNYSTTQRKICPPSIPTDSLGYKCITNEKIEKVVPKKANPPVPGSYNIRTDLIKDHGLAWTTNITMSRKEDETALPGPGAYNAVISFQNPRVPATACFNSELDRFNPKKIKKTVQPGPGQYNVNDNRLNRQFSETHFNSKSVRFSSDKASNLGPGSYGQTNNKSLKTFNKKVLQGYREVVDSNRKTIFSLATNKNPGPGEYVARQGMTFQLQKALLRKHNLSQFANTRRQVFEPKEYDLPGPGCYNPVLLKSNSKGNIGYKKVEVINLKEEEDQQTPSPLDYTYNNFSMSKKIEKQAKRLTLTDKKPFNTGAERFHHYEDSNAKNPETKRSQTFDTQNNQSSIDADQYANINFEGPKKIKKLIMTSVKVKVPFGTSTTKFEQKQQNDVGPGYYNSSSSWVKPSYSIKGKLDKKK